uniref:Membrane transporter protein n=1 Tax=Panagrolaimus sp. JU765 TaxID=591449 RepID=A0AC34QNP6_9BILA
MTNSSSNLESIVPFTTSKPKQRNLKEFYQKYFLYGQQLAPEDESIIDTNIGAFDSDLFEKHRNFLAFLIPFVVTQFVWWNLAIRFDYFDYYHTHWQMPITMIFGGVISGMTAEGGGAIAYPVMTFILQTSPETARDFSLMVQAINMSMACFAILFMKLQVEWRAICYGLLGGIPGTVLGLYTIDQYFTPSEKKMMFVSIWASFGIALYILNREKKRQTTPVIQYFSFWKAIVLIFTGVIGGIFTSFAGSGLDICIFSVITLLFRVSEKTATPSTIIAMAILSLFSVFWRVVIDFDIDMIALDYLKVTVPVGVFFAPFGAFLGSYFHRLTLAWFVCILEAIAYCGFLATRPSLILLGFSFGILFIGFGFFTFLAKAGQKLVKHEKIKTISRP